MRVFGRLFTTMILGCAALLAGNPHAHAVTGGTPTLAHTYYPVVNYQVERVDEKQKEQLNSCTGTFITPFFLLTASHCFDKIKTGAEFRALRMGMYPFNVEIARKEGRGGHVKVQEKIKLHRFNGGPAPYMSNPDIAIIEFDRYMSSQSFPVSKIAPRIDEQITFGGYGCDRVSKEDRTDFQYASNVVGNLGEFAITLHRKKDIAICEGDSGGPMLRREANGSFSVVGVISYYNPVNSAFGGSRDRFARIDSDTGRRVDRWIESVIAKDASLQPLELKSIGATRIEQLRQ